MSGWGTVVQLLTAGGVGAFGASLVQTIPALRRSGAEREGVQAGTEKTRAELELAMIEAGREQVAFLRSEITAMRDEFTRSREELTRSLAAARVENEELNRELVATRAELSTLRGVVAALRYDVTNIGEGGAAGDD